MWQRRSPDDPLAGRNGDRFDGHESAAVAGWIAGWIVDEHGTRWRGRGERGYPIPDIAKTQPNVIEGGVPGGGSSGDRHLLIVDRDTWALFELFATRWNAGAGRWEAGSGAVFDLSSNVRRPEGWTSADAAGLAILPGLVRYDEAARGPVRHALRVTVLSTKRRRAFLAIRRSSRTSSAACRHMG